MTPGCGAWFVKNMNGDDLEYCELSYYLSHYGKKLPIETGDSVSKVLQKLDEKIASIHSKDSNYSSKIPDVFDVLLNYRNNFYTINILVMQKKLDRYLKSISFIIVNPS